MIVFYNTKKVAVCFAIYKRHFILRGDLFCLFFEFSFVAYIYIFAERIYLTIDAYDLCSR